MVLLVLQLDALRNGKFKDRYVEEIIDGQRLSTVAVFSVRLWDPAAIPRTTRPLVINGLASVMLLTRLRTLPT